MSANVIRFITTRSRRKTWLNKLSFAGLTKESFRLVAFTAICCAD